MKQFYLSILLLLVGYTATSQVLTFEDPDFKAYLLLSDPTNPIARNSSDQFIAIDANGDGQIQVSEAAVVSKLRISSNATINSVVGIKNFVNLTDLYLRYVSNIAVVDVSEMPLLYNAEISEDQALTLIDISDCPVLHRLRSWSSPLLTQIDFTNCPLMKKLDVYDNAITSVSFAGTPGLDYILLGWNQLTSIDFSNLPDLVEVDVRNNQLSSLDFSANPLLTKLNCNENQTIASIAFAAPEIILDLYCYENQISTLPFQEMSSLVNFGGENNNFTIMDFSNSPNLYNMTCHNNLLISLNIQNGKYENYVSICPNPLLQFICVDANQVSNVNGFLGNCSSFALSTSCNFFPMTTDFLIQGMTTFDTNGNGCDIADPALLNQKLSVTVGATTAYYFGNNSGEFNIPLPEGTYTVAPFLENLSYFTTVPESITAAFPGSSNPLTQNFCITPNGIHNDLEIVLTPFTPARPGFDATYRLIYRNKGNQTMSGSINLAFEDSKLDYVSSVPATDSQSANSLVWNYSNLIPGEVRVISLVLNVNAPTDVPPVNIADELPFGATILPVIGDDTTADNHFGLKQIVVGSFDPNDKTCLEGSVVTEDVIGNYVHYTIRFENTGSFAAERVEVTDFIDAAKFNIASLIPLSASHSFTTRLLPAQNKVIFTFDNINLPFQDADNDGYLTFKIKTNPALTIGSTFTNNARIYFDYNFPIVTNTASTTIQALGTSDFEFSNYFVLYPNPANNILNLSAKNDITVKSIEIYNLLGQLVIAIPNSQTTSSIDISNLKTGNYFIKINSDKGITNAKFVKN